MEGSLPGRLEIGFAGETCVRVVGFVMDVYRFEYFKIAKVAELDIGKGGVVLSSVSGKIDRRIEVLAADAAVVTFDLTSVDEFDMPQSLK